jgi:predicted permease
MLQDFRHAIRAFAKTPGFTLVAILVLAIGIGANSAMFTLVNALLFKPLSGQAGDLVGLFSRSRVQADSYRAFSYPNYADIREQSRDVFDGLMAHTFAMVGLPAGETTRRSFVAVVSANYFDTMGVSLAAGRPFTADEERPGARLPVVIVGYERWREAGLRSSYIGTQLRINATDFTVVGVAPQGFTATMAMATPDMWLPLGMFDEVVNDMFKNQGTGLGDRGHRALVLAGRLKAGVGVEAATARLDTLARQLEAAYPAENKDQTLLVHELARMSTGTSPQTDTPLTVASALLMSVSGIVLVIACLNVANMLLARGTARAREMAIRLAVGGARGRIVRQLVTESLLLAVAGSAAGLLLAFWVTRLLVGTLAPLLPLTVTFDPTPDVNVLIVTTTLAFAATLLFGVGPALKLTRADLVNDLKGSVAMAGARFSGRRWQARNLLVVGQMALSLAMLCTGGLFARAALAAAATDPGFRYERLLLATVDPAMAGFDEVRGREAHRRLIERLRAIPGVEHAAFASTVPFGEFHESMPVEPVGAAAAPAQGPSPRYRIVGADYFGALGLSMVRGREFTAVEEDSVTAPRVAIVDELLARRLFPDRDPLGQMIRISRRDRETGSGNDGEPMEIVGIAPPIRDTLLERTAVPHVYVPTGRNYRGTQNLHIRLVSADPRLEADALAAVRPAIAEADARIPVLDLMPMRRFHDRSLELWAVRSGGNMVISLGSLALLLAVVGIYGVKSYVVSQRTREIGIRVAIGARPRDVLLMVVREGAALTLAGLAIGLPLAGLAGLGLSRLLYEVSPLDPIVFVGAPLVLAGAALVASYLPARRATRVAPVTALRAD